MFIGEKFIIAATLLFLTTNLYANTSTSSEPLPPLVKGTKVVAGPLNTDEFYIIAENDEPKLKEMLAEHDIQSQNNNSQNNIAENNKKMLTAKKIVSAKPSKKIALKKSLTVPKVSKNHKILANKKTNKAKAPHKMVAVKKQPLVKGHKMKKRLLATNTMIVKKDIQKIRMHHKPSQMELALNDALEIAIKKKQFTILKSEPVNKLSKKVSANSNKKVKQLSIQKISNHMSKLRGLNALNLKAKMASR